MKGVVMFPDKVLRKKIEPVKKIDKKTDLAIEKVQADMSLTEKIKQKTLNMYYALKDYLAGLFR